MGYVLRAGKGWSSALIIAACEDLENLSASDIHGKTVQETSRHTRNIHAAQYPRREALSKMNKNKKTPFFEEENGKHFQQHER